jgi:S1-C subfamily serine protease
VLAAGAGWFVLNRAPRGSGESTTDPVGMDRPVGFGTGFFITEDGYLLTNHHVVEQAKALGVQMGDQSYEARVVEVDPESDLALLKVEGRFRPVAFSSAGQARLGQTVFTVGFPIPDLQGSSPKVTKGVISSLRGIQDDLRNYQIDAAVQPGNSGGPLADEAGNVLGVVVARLNDQTVMATTGAIPQNVNYAVKASYVMAFLQGHPDVLSRVQMANEEQAENFEQAVDQMLSSVVMILIY